MFGVVHHILVRNTTEKRRAEEFLARLPSLPIGPTVPDEGDIIAAARLKAT